MFTMMSCDVDHFEENPGHKNASLLVSLPYVLRSTCFCFGDDT